MEIISDLRERKLQVRTEERKGGYGTELLNNTAVEGIVGPAELSVDGEVQYTFSFGEKETLTEYLKKEKLDEKKLLRLYRQFLEKMLLAEEYFLVPENLILCSDAIFLTSERELYLAYMDGYAADVADELAKITEEIMKVMDHGCRSLTFLVYGIHKICREEHFTLNKLEQSLGQDLSNSTEIDLNNSLEVSSTLSTYFFEEEKNLASSISIARFAYNKYVNSNGATKDYNSSLFPMYLRKSQAERSLEEKQERQGE